MYLGKAQNFNVVFTKYQGHRGGLALYNDRPQCLLCQHRHGLLSSTEATMTGPQLP